MKNATFEFAFSLHPHTMLLIHAEEITLKYSMNVNKRLLLFPQVLLCEREKRHVLLCLSCYRCDDAKELSDDKRIFSFSNNSLASLDCMLRRKKATLLLKLLSFLYFVSFMCLCGLPEKAALKS